MISSVAMDRAVKSSELVAPNADSSIGELKYHKHHIGAPKRCGVANTKEYTNIV